MDQDVGSLEGGESIILFELIIEAILLLGRLKYSLQTLIPELSP